MLDITVNGTKRRANVAPRTHLADFLREELLLTGTHIGCEHGVCGACTLLVDGQPTRSCLTFAAMCDGAQVQTIEGLEQDAAMTALRDAFTKKHALQCGYCTPGMLVTARDIVLRLPDADDDRVRLELAGHLCRCTGYNGIVRAIRHVLEAQKLQSFAGGPVPSTVLPVLSPLGATTPAAVIAAPRAVLPAKDGLEQSIFLSASPDAVWAAVQDPALIAACVPGARLISVEGSLIEGEMLSSLGPIQARFTGKATLSLDAVDRRGSLVGEGRDAITGTLLSGTAGFVVLPAESGSEIRLSIGYALRGTLAQLARPAIVSVFAADLASQVGANLDARLRGVAAPAATTLGAGAMVMRVLWQAIRQLLGKGR